MVKSKNLQKLETLKNSFNNDIIKKERLAKKIRNEYIVASNLPNLNFKSSKLKDNLRIKALEDVEFVEHIHISQSQTIYVKKGIIINLIDNLSFRKGESFFTSKKNLHHMKYLKDAEALIIYLPHLEKI